MLILGIASPRSRISNMSNNARRKNKGREPRIESQELLDYNLNLMVTFDYDKFEEGSVYINKLLSNIEDQSVIYFLSQNADRILSTYTQVINGVMPQAVNYSLDQPQYSTMLTPLQAFIVCDKLTKSLSEGPLADFIGCIVEKLVNSNQEKDQLEQYLKTMQDVEAEQRRKVAEYVTKALNSIMLKVIQRGDVTFIVKGLAKVLLDSRSHPEWPTKPLTKTNSLAAKCMLRSLKKVPGNLEKISLESLFYSIILYTQNFSETSDDTNAWKVFRAIINELVKNLYQAKIWEGYSQATQGRNETIVSRWINAAQVNLQNNIDNSQILPSQSNFTTNTTPALDTSGFHSGITSPL